MNARHSWSKRRKFAQHSSRCAAQFHSHPLALNLPQVRTVAKKTIHSTTKLLPAWKQLLLDLQMPHKILPRDVKTRWNSTYDMIVAALKYRRAYREFTMDETNGLISHVLTAAEWQVLKDLQDILCDATLFFSRDSATLATVIPAMDKIDSLLATAVLKRPGGKRTQEMISAKHAK
ncbi:hypothetical protein B0H10DRAFT_1812935 [Mycena sp. CBHHK59/15]|nr:hypothetical protein B0H10DRAFT_1861326 [Mycena sp. CBHHK59/15]KAJ6609756.1 hypothetical protein B0H10DRAFT_1812935 [Mycena sp. CBHHK59/15]